MLLGQIKLGEDDLQSIYDSSAQVAHEYNHTRGLTSKGLTLGSLGLAGILSLLAAQGMKAHGKNDAIDQKQSIEWAKKYLNTNKVDVKPEPELGNAYYYRDPNSGKHIIRYDPEFNKSIVAHEIGHGMSRFPRIPLSGLLAGPLLASGGFDYGTSLGLENGSMDGLGRFIGGAAMLTPTLIDEYGASSNARKILKNEGIKPRGLTRAWSTYALPGAVGLGALGAGYLTADHYSNKLHQIDPTAEFQFK